MGVPHLIVYEQGFNAGVPYLDLWRTKYGDESRIGKRGEHRMNRFVIGQGVVSTATCRLLATAASDLYLFDSVSCRAGGRSCRLLLAPSQQNSGRRLLEANVMYDND